MSDYTATTHEGNPASNWIVQAMNWIDATEIPRGDTQRLRISAFALLAAGIFLAGCASKPINAGFSLGPSAHLYTQGTKSLLSTEDGSRPPPGVVIIAAGEGGSVDARVQVGPPVYSVTSTIQSTTPPGVLDSLAKWLAPDPGEDPPAPEPNK